MYVFLITCVLCSDRSKIFPARIPWIATINRDGLSVCGILFLPWLHDISQSMVFFNQFWLIRLTYSPIYMPRGNHTIVFFPCANKAMLVNMSMLNIEQYKSSSWAQFLQYTVYAIYFATLKFMWQYLLKSCCFSSFLCNVSFLVLSFVGISS